MKQELNIFVVKMNFLIDRVKLFKPWALSNFYQLSTHIRHVLENIALLDILEFLCMRWYINMISPYLSNFALQVHPIP